MTSIARPRLILAGVTQEGFDQAYAQQVFAEGQAVLDGLAARHGSVLSAADRVFVEAVDLDRYLRALPADEVQAFILQTSTFASGELAMAAACWAGKHRVPVVIWGMPEPSAGGVLRANSFCGVNFFASILHSLNVRYKWVFGAPSDAAWQEEIVSTLAATGALHRLRGSLLGLVGSARVPGFYGSNFDEAALADRFGLRAHQLDLTGIFTAAEKASDAEVEAILAEIHTKTEVEPGIGREELARAARLTAALRAAAGDGGYAGLAVKCWPEFAGGYGAAVCTAVAMLNNDGIITADESDIWGLVTMLCAYHLGGNGPKPTLLDAVAFDEERNQLAMWHCGATSWELCRAGCRVRTMRHFNQVSAETGTFLPAANHLLIERGPVTLARLMGQAGAELLVTEGVVEDGPAAFEGAFGAVALDVPAGDFVNTVMTAGCEHHYALIHGRQAARWRELAYWAGVAVAPLRPRAEAGPFGAV